eukprot:2214507-Pyramimonas_sp.AAC.1
MPGIGLLSSSERPPLSPSPNPNMQHPEFFNTGFMEAPTLSPGPVLHPEPLRSRGPARAPARPKLAKNLPSG